MPDKAAKAMVIGVVHQAVIGMSQILAYLCRACDHVLDIVSVPWTVDVGIVPLVGLILHCAPLWLSASCWDSRAYPEPTIIKWLGTRAICKLSAATHMLAVQLLIERSAHHVLWQW